MDKYFSVFIIINGIHTMACIAVYYRYIVLKFVMGKHTLITQEGHYHTSTLYLLYNWGGHHSYLFEVSLAT